jgi:hypothetical protein
VIGSLSFRVQVSLQSHVLQEYTAAIQLSNAIVNVHLEKVESEARSLKATLASKLEQVRLSA